MPEVTAEAVRKLREKTGLPMMDCKKALTESDGDEGKAVDWLRAKGLKAAAKMVDRVASEGRIACFVDTAKQIAGICELRCETAPVANTDDFIALATLIAKQAATNAVNDANAIKDQKSVDHPSQTIQDVMNDVFNRIRENMQIARVASLKGHVGSYVHHNGQVGVLVEFNGECPAELRSDVCMHITAFDPPYLRRDDVPAAMVEKERNTARDEVKGKPANVVDKIVDGKLGRWFGEIVLLEQPFAKDDKKTVDQVLKAAGSTLTINRFVRFKVGGVQ